MRELNPRKGGELVPIDPTVGAEVATRWAILNPVTALRRRSAKKAELQEQDVTRLTELVTEKLLNGIHEKGMVSLFHDKETNELITELYSVYFSSPDLDSVHVWAAREHREKQGRPEPMKIWLQIHEHRPLHAPMYGERVLHVQQRWDMQDGEYQTRFTKDVPKGEDSSLTNAEKIKFLRELLASEVDEAQIERKFGAPYTPGATHSNHRSDDYQLHHAYWVRDMKGKLPPLGAESAEIIETESQTLALNP